MKPEHPGHAKKVKLHKYRFFACLLFSLAICVAYDLSRRINASKLMKISGPIASVPEYNYETRGIFYYAKIDLLNFPDVTFKAVHFPEVKEFVKNCKPNDTVNLWVRTYEGVTLIQYRKHIYKPFTFGIQKNEIEAFAVENKYMTYQNWDNYNAWLWWDMALLITVILFVAFLIYSVVWYNGK